MQTYQVGQDVRVEFIGTIVEAQIKNGVVYYRVQGNMADCFWVSDKEITLLELPQDKTYTT